ncbi:MAG: MBOAT family protein [Firmicutes bacterium]|nr:MBOAT family protein [Bacillota bacterium]
MIFSSTVFLLAFLPLTLLAYFAVPKRMVMGRNMVLLIASLIFYGWGEPKYILVMLISILMNYFLALAVEKKRGTTDQHGGKAMLILAVVGNLGILGFFKYTDFIINTMNNLLGAGWGLLGIALPIGISFYTFQTMSYVIDVYRGKVHAQRDLVAFAMYVTLFPQLIAGPIVRYSDVEADLTMRRTQADQMAEGIRRFVIGFGKKILLANQIYVIWKEISAMEEMSMATAWLGAVAFTFQIYFDFSGYSDMAIGLGKILGFEYLENFNYPYISRSITEFWRRWHMSLSSWFKEYVYVPLGGNRKGLTRQLINIGIVWALTGLWHGASWNFVAWGVYFGVILIIEKLWLLRVLEKVPAVVGHIYSLILIVAGWVIFAIDDLGQVGHYLMQMFGGSGMVTDDAFWYFGSSRIWLLAACIVGSTPLPAKVCRYIKKKLDGMELLEGVLETGLLLTIMTASMAFLVSGSYNPFLYFRF